jgi:glycosyltransferase involved in cell wall biosynthesis
MVLFVGSIVPRKGVNTLLEAFHLIQEQVPASILYLIGPTDSTEGGKSTQTEFVAKLQVFVKENGLTDNVRFVGRVSDVESVMHAADVFVLPSLAEGMPNVLLEAMASALPCIASDIPGVREVITNNADGCLFAPGDVKQLADKLLHLLCNPEVSIRLGHAGRKKIEEHYSIRKTAQNYQSIFQMLVSGAPHAT